MIVHLAKKLSTIPLQAYQNAMITRLAWRKGLFEEAHGVQILRDTKRVLSLVVAGAEDGMCGRLSLDLLRPIAAEYKRTERVMQRDAEGLYGESVGAMSFTRAEIKDFIDETGDRNPIHRTACPVVPGLLILHRFLSLRSAVTALQMRFYVPVYAGDRIDLMRHASMVYGVVDQNCKYGIEEEFR